LLAIDEQFLLKKLSEPRDDAGLSYFLDHIALPSKRGAMENWGLITYGEDYLCLNPSTTGSSQRLNVASIIAHELAHQVSLYLANSDAKNRLY
jgi:aminopeptidase N